MGICSWKPADNVPFAVRSVNPVGSSKGNSSTSGGSGSSGGGGGSNCKSSKGHRVADQNMKSSSPPPTTGGANGSSAEPHKNSPAVAVGKIITPNLKMFTYVELRSATKNFRPDTVLGEGGFGRVFRGWVDEKTYAPSRPGVGIPVAVKKSSPDSEQGLKEWQAEVKFLGKFSHPNLVKLLGYCWEDKEFLLVYEYMQKGSLETHLFRNGADTLPWETRLRIAIDAARGLAFLHNTEKQVIYRDFKASNILLDGDYNAKLSDFGLAKSGPLNGDSHVTTQVLGTYGYAAPEYMSTGHLYVKSDVFGFGVVLLELITGLRVIDLNRPSGEHNLVDWCKPMLPDRRKLRKLVDPRLEGQYPSRGAFQTAELVLKCLETDQKNRPSMEEVLLSLELISTIKTKPKESKPIHKHAATYHGNQRSPLRKYPTGPSATPTRARAQQRSPAPNSY